MPNIVGSVKINAAMVILGFLLIKDFIASIACSHEEQAVDKKTAIRWCDLIRSYKYI
ncbi:glycosidase [Paenibacillus popilliae ATCC 14706]|uniref:Glycosidase n=1 Tax=Paenibacillus popilliae ATCC 14706 TaxID=1212764 RepID=M9LG68_PAEPP|nr:glycosidase [Paenibacillus popilliae ATCC 14706]